MENRLKNCMFPLAGTVFLSFTGCAGTAGMSPTPPAAHNQWTWRSGSNSVSQFGRYGLQGVATVGDTPGSRVQANTWTDTSGNFWLFGGYGRPSAGVPGNAGIEGDLNDLWEYSNGIWTWVAGSNVTEQSGSYGTQGVPSPNNHPGARFEAVSWTDASGNFWLFGGLGIDSAGNRGDLNDLWKYRNGAWTWMSGSNTGAVYTPA